MTTNILSGNSGNSTGDDSTLARYEQAQAMVQGIMTRRVVLNDGVFPHWINGRAGFWYLRDTATGKTFQLVDVEKRNNQAAFDHDALASALTSASGRAVDADDLPITIGSLTLSETVFTVNEVQFSAFDKRWVFTAQDQQCHSVGFPAEPPAEPAGALSPDGTQLVFVKDHNLWLRNIATHEERALTRDGISDNPYATASAGAAAQVLWSPDGKTLLTHQLDTRQITNRAMIEHAPLCGSVKPKLHQVKMAYPGDEHIEAYRLILINVATGEQQVVHHPLRLWKFGSGLFTDEKLCCWHNDSQRLYYVDIERGSKVVRLAEYDSVSGNTRVLIEERADTFVKLAHNDALPELTFLPDTEEVVWFSERSGWAHLYLYDLKTGRLKQAITQGEWLVRHILYLDAERRTLILHTGGRHQGVCPHYRDICSVNIDTGDITDIAVGDYEHSVFGASNGRQAGARAGLGIDSPGAEGISPDGQYLVTTRSRVDTLPESVLLNDRGEALMALEVAEPLGLPDNWVWPQPVKTLAPDGKTEIFGVVYYPPGYLTPSDDAPSDQQYSVLDFSNGQAGFTMVPQGSFINGPCFDYPYYYGAAFAALGFIVVALEGRGMPNREKAFHDYSHGFMASACALEDRVAGIKQLAAQDPGMDLSRVGIVGGDGFSSPVYGLLEHPDFYTVGVAMAYEDARFKQAALSECFEGYSAEGKQMVSTDGRFADQIADRLEGKLLLIHGLTDMYVPQSGTFRLVAAIQEANKTVDLMVMPQVGHDIPAYALRRTWDYLVTHLQEETPPANFDLTTGFDLLIESNG